MSKAFDSVKRTILLDDLKQIVEADELHILQILIKDVTLQVRNINKLGNKFETNIGIPQGDCLSPILFTFYLANSLKDQQDCDNNLLTEHNYSNKDKILNIEEQFADDIGWATTSKEKLEEIKIETKSKLELRNLKINLDKTEQYTISATAEDEWKKCKYLGSMLTGSMDTDSDINRQKQLYMAMYNKYKDKLQEKKLSLTIRMRIFNAFIRPVFMYNRELWAFTKKTENVIDTFHRNLLRKILNIHYPHIITNIDLLKPNE